MTDQEDLLTKFLIKKGLTPAFTFKKLNAHSRDAIRKSLRGKSGIYMIFNNSTGHYYIGSASTNRLYTRYCNHMIYMNGSKRVKNAVNKYGIGSFDFLVLELFSEIVTKENNKKLLSLENQYLKSLLPTYNILTEAGNSLGYKHTKLSRLKMKINYNNRRRTFKPKLNAGIDFSLEREIAFNSPIRYLSKESLIDMNRTSIPLCNLDKTIPGELNETVKDIYHNYDLTKGLSNVNLKTLDAHKKK